MKPSAKTLESAFPGKGRELRKVLESDRETLAARYELPSPYHYKGGGYSLIDVKLEVCSRILSGYGVETILRDPYGYPPLEIARYVNMGDAYATTIIYRGDHYRVSTWGDVVASYERRRGAIA